MPNVAKPKIPKVPKVPKVGGDGTDDKPKSSYNPYKFERLLELQSEMDGLITFKTQSFTNHKHIWHPMIDTQSCRVECDCPDFLTRKYPNARRSGMVPTCYSPYLCKHLLQAVLVLKQMGRLLEPEEIDTGIPDDEILSPVKLEKKKKTQKKQKSGVEMLTDAVKATHADEITGDISGRSGLTLLDTAIQQLNATGFLEEATALAKMKEDIANSLFYLD